MSDPANLTNWQPTIPPDQNIYEESTTLKAPLGTQITVGDRVFRYAENGGADLDIGEFVASPDTTYSSKQTAGGAAAIGTTGVTAYIANSVEANQFADGYLVHADSGNQGYMYRVRKHAAIGDTATGTVFLYDQIKKAIAVTDKLSFVPNKYKDVGVAGATSAIAGVAPIDVTAGNYFWCQVKGPASLRVLGAAAYGALLVPGATGGATAINATANDAPVAQVVSNAGTTGDHVIANVMLP